MVEILFFVFYFLFFIFCVDLDGLARSEALGETNGDHARCVRRGGLRCWVHDRILPDDAPYIRRWSGIDGVDHGSKLAVLQSPPAELVGPERGRAPPQAAGGCADEEERIQEVGLIRLVFFFSFFAELEEFC